MMAGFKTFDSKFAHPCVQYFHAVDGRRQVRPEQTPRAGPPAGFISTLRTPSVRPARREGSWSLELPPATATATATLAAWSGPSRSKLPSLTARVVSQTQDPGAQEPEPPHGRWRPGPDRASPTAQARYWLGGVAGSLSADRSTDG